MKRIGSVLLDLRLCLRGTPLRERACRGAVESVGLTVSDMDRSVAFYSDVLAFKPISDVEVDGPEYDQLWGIFGVRARVVRMQLGEQQLELIEFLSPPDVRPIPVPSYSNDLWFQHFAIVVRDMETAWAQLRKHHVRQISPRPQTIPISNPAAAGIKAIKFRDPDGHNLELLWFPDGKGNPIWKTAWVRYVFGHRPHGHDRAEYGKQHQVLSRSARHDGRGRHIEHGGRTGTSR